MSPLSRLCFHGFLFLEKNIGVEGNAKQLSLAFRFMKQPTLEPQQRCLPPTGLRAPQEHHLAPIASWVGHNP